MLFTLENIHCALWISLTATSSYALVLTECGAAMTFNYDLTKADELRTTQIDLTDSKFVSCVNLHLNFQPVPLIFHADMNLVVVLDTKTTSHRLLKAARVTVA